MSMTATHQVEGQRSSSPGPSESPAPDNTNFDTPAAAAVHAVAIPCLATGVSSTEAAANGPITNASLSTDPNSLVTSITAIFLAQLQKQSEQFGKQMELQKQVMEQCLKTMATQQAEIQKGRQESDTAVRALKEFRAEVANEQEAFKKEIEAQLEEATSACQQQILKLEAHVIETNERSKAITESIVSFGTKALAKFFSKNWEGTPENVQKIFDAVLEKMECLQDKCDRAILNGRASDKARKETSAFLEGIYKRLRITTGTSDEKKAALIKILTASGL